MGDRPRLAVLVGWRLEAGADAHAWPLPALCLVHGRYDHSRLVLRRQPCHGADNRFCPVRVNELHDRAEILPGRIMSA